MFCSDVFPPFKHFIGSNIFHSGGAWISGVSGGSTVPKLGSGSSARLFLSLLLQHFITHTYTHTHSISTKLGKVHADARPGHHELNTVHLGGMKRSEGASDVKTTPPPPHPKTSTAGSRVVLLPRQQAPQGADAGVIAEGGGRSER